MATLQQIRSKGPLLVIAVGLALFAFIAGDAWQVLQPHQSQDVGEVNGESLSAQDYQTMVEEYKLDDAEIVLTAYGTVGRIVKSSVDLLREKGIKAGLIRPITVYPFPKDAFKKVGEMANVKEIVTVELSTGQYIEDVKLYTECRKPVKFYGRSGGNVMSPEDVVEFVLKEVK